MWDNLNDCIGKHLKLGFVIVMLRSDVANEQQEINVLLGCERDDKYKKYINDLQVTPIRTQNGCVLIVGESSLQGG